MQSRHDMTCGALILAAGASTRLGHPKQLVCLGSETLLDRSVRIAQEAGCEPIVVVLGAAEDQIRAQCELRDVLVVSNSDWTQGVGTTISRGIRAFENVDGAIVMTCDMPAVTADHLRALAESGSIKASLYAGRKGVPAYFPKDRFPELMELKGDTGARELLKAAPGIELPSGEFDIDTSDDLEKVRAIFS